MPQQRDDDPVVINMSVPRDFRRRLKAAAAMRGVTMREGLVEACEEWIAKVEHPATPARIRGSVT